MARVLERSEAADSDTSLFPLPPSPSWSLIVDPPRPGAENMAIDTALLRRAREGESYLRLYQWSPGCLSFGRNEPALSRYDRDGIARRGLDTVRRPTGGRAVWHQQELTYAVAAAVGAFGSPRGAYRAIHEMLAEALRTVGIPATIAPRPPRAPALGAGACFAAPAGGEVLVGGRKLVGSAQVREGRSVLQHGSILLDGSQDVVEAVTRGNGSPACATSVSAVLGTPARVDALANAIGHTAAGRWGGTWDIRRVEPEPPLVRRYADPAWTWRR